MPPIVTPRPGQASNTDPSPSYVDNRPRRWRVDFPLREPIPAVNREHAMNIANKVYPAGRPTIESLDGPEKLRREKGEWKWLRGQPQQELALKKEGAA